MRVDPAVAGKLGGQLGTEAGVDEPAATPFDHGADLCNRFGCRPTGLHVVVSARRGQILTGGPRGKSRAAGTRQQATTTNAVDLDAIVATLEIEGVRAFCDSYRELLARIDAKVRRAAATT